MKKEIKIKDEIFFMKNNSPKSGVVDGISKHEGKYLESYNTVDVPEGKTKIIYHISESLDSIDDMDAYSSMSDLQKAVFNTK